MTVRRKVQKWTERCAGCGELMELTRGPHGVSPTVVFMGPRTFHLGCARTYRTRAAARKGERFILRLTLEERAELTELQDLLKVPSVAEALRLLWRAELTRLKKPVRTNQRRT